MVPQIEIPTSKSITNRLLILQQYDSNNLTIGNMSQSEDSILLQKCLQQISQAVPQSFVFVDNCGTAFRFLCAYLSFQKGEWILDGTARLRQRPIAHLVEAINNAGGEIHYMEKVGFAPLKIIGKTWQSDCFYIDASYSSQYVSALMLCLPFNACDARIVFDKNISSWQYIDLTLQLMTQIGINIHCQDGEILYKHTTKWSQKQMNVEADWSSAAFWYLYVALSDNQSLFIKGLSQSRLQPDSKIAIYMNTLGLTSFFNEHGAMIKKTKPMPKYFEADCNNTPDLVPILSVLCAGKQIKGCLHNVKNLQFKESNRIEALQKELSPFASVTYKNGTLTIVPTGNPFMKKHFFHSYTDHRIVMALAMLKHQIPQIEFDDTLCVKKSYPDFWKYYHQLIW